MWTFALFGLFLLLWLIYRKKCFSILANLGIPGPTPNLLFGNAFDMLYKRDPFICHSEWFKKYGNVVGYYLGTEPIVLVSDVEFLKKIQVSEFQKFINKPNSLRSTGPGTYTTTHKRVEGFSQAVNVLRDHRWKEIRSTITPSFTASKMKQMTPTLNNVIDSLVKILDKKCISNESFNIHSLYQHLSMDAVVRTSFGIQTDVQNNPQNPFMRSAKLIYDNDIRNPISLLTVSFGKLENIFAKINRIRLRFQNKGINPINEMIASVKTVIAARRKTKEARRLDLLQLMIDAEVDDSVKITSDDLTAKMDDNKAWSGSTTTERTRKMTDDDILDNSILFFLAGFDNTSNALAFATHFLVHYPEVQEKIRQEIKHHLHLEGKWDYNLLNKLQYLEQVINESMRLYPPVPLAVRRECSEDMKLGNIRLSKGITIQIPTFHLQRDPRYWGEDAHLFNPDRFSPENKPKVSPLAFQVFGAGPRNCVGMRFAMMNMKLTLARLISLYRFEKCPETEKEDMQLKASIQKISPKNGVWLKVVSV